MAKLLDLPQLPNMYELSSPEIVKAFDLIRFDLEKQESDELAEFCFFSREYPRCYRYHIDCAQHRLKSIYRVYQEAYEFFQSDVLNDPNAFEISYGSVHLGKQIYWDFESFLSAVNTSLDLMARIVGVAYKEQTPPSFNKICKKNLPGLVQVMKRAQELWVSKMKDYRDCFVHYTPVDTLLLLTAVRYKNGWEIRARLPVNPNEREIINFRFERKLELLRYAITIYRHLCNLDKAVARKIIEEYNNHQFPQRVNSLLFVGRRCVSSK